MGLQFDVYPLPLWEYGEKLCASDARILKELAAEEILVYFRLSMKLDLFVSVDTTDDSDDGKSLADQLGKNIAGDNESDRFLSEQWRELAEKDPCVIVTATADIDIPLLGTLKFGNIAGGYCTFPHENGHRCTPSGAFLNVNQGFKIEGGVAGILASFLEGEKLLCS